MREGMGLYRGKRLNNGEWVEGNLLTGNDGPPDADYAEILVKNKHGYNVIWCEVDMETIGQWTGLVDKNGVKVFEGDIVESIFTKKPYTVCYGSYTYINEYEEEEYAWGWYNTDEDGFATAFALPAEWAIVISNIHDKAVEE